MNIEKEICVHVFKCAGESCGEIFQNITRDKPNCTHCGYDSRHHRHLGVLVYTLSEIIRTENSNPPFTGEVHMNDSNETEVRSVEDDTSCEDVTDECECGYCTSCNEAADNIYLAQVRTGRAPKYDPFS